MKNDNHYRGETEEKNTNMKQTYVNYLKTISKPIKNIIQCDITYMFFFYKNNRT